MAQPGLRARADGERGYQQALGQPVELEATVEARGDAAEVALGVLPEIAGMVGAAEAGLDVAQNPLTQTNSGRSLGLRRPTTRADARGRPR